MQLSLRKYPMKLSAWIHPFLPLTGQSKKKVINMRFFVRPCSQLQVAQGILDAQSIVDQLEGKIVNNIGKHGDDGGDDDGMGMGTGKGKGRRSKGKKLTMALNDLRTSIGQARDGAALALQGGLGVLAAQGKSIRGLFENAGLDVPPGF